MEEFGSVSNAPRQIRKCAWRTPYLVQQNISLPCKFTLHEKGLTSCYLPRLLDLLVGALGFNPCLIDISKSLGKFGCLVQSLLLQGLALSYGILELLFDLPHPRLMSSAGGLLHL